MLATESAQPDVPFANARAPCSRKAKDCPPCPQLCNELLRCLWHRSQQTCLPRNKPLHDAWTPRIAHDHPERETALNHRADHLPYGRSSFGRSATWLNLHERPPKCSRLWRQVRSAQHRSTNLASQKWSRLVARETGRVRLWWRPRYFLHDPQKD